VSECTFGLPIFKWPPTSQVIAEILAWWQENADQEQASLLLAYAVGKAQRLLAELSAREKFSPFPGPILAHGAILQVCETYKKNGVSLPDIKNVMEVDSPRTYRRALILAPPSALGIPWTRRFFPFVSGMASGWMRIRGLRRRRALDRGFVLSDHADWPALLDTIASSGARKIYLIHGSTDPPVRYLKDQGLEVEALHFAGRDWEVEGED